MLPEPPRADESASMHRKNSLPGAGKSRGVAPGPPKGGNHGCVCASAAYGDSLGHLHWSCGDVGGKSRLDFVPDLRPHYGGLCARGFLRRWAALNRNGASDHSRPRCLSCSSTRDIVLNAHSLCQARWDDRRLPTDAHGRLLRPRRRSLWPFGRRAAFFLDSAGTVEATGGPLRSSF